MPAGAMREGRQSAHVSMAGQEQGSRRATARREERGTEGGARINTCSCSYCTAQHHMHAACQTETAGSVALK
jgi:hypothetical protein